MCNGGSHKQRGAEDITKYGQTSFTSYNYIHGFTDSSKREIMLKPKSDSGRTSGLFIDSGEGEICLRFNMGARLASALFLLYFGLRDKLCLKL